VWLAAGKELYEEGMLCIGCLEKRLNRELNRYDFILAPINEIYDGSKKSNRLIDRLRRY
jgi:hypothetical protein